MNWPFSLQKWVQGAARETGGISCCPGLRAARRLNWVWRFKVLEENTTKQWRYAIHTTLCFAALRHNQIKKFALALKLSQLSWCRNWVCWWKDSLVGIGVFHEIECRVAEISGLLSFCRFSFQKRRMWFARNPRAVRNYSALWPQVSGFSLLLHSGERHLKPCKMFLWQLLESVPWNMCGFHNRETIHGGSRGRNQVLLLQTTWRRDRIWRGSWKMLARHQEIVLGGNVSISHLHLLEFGWKIWCLPFALREMAGNAQLRRRELPRWTLVGREPVRVHETVAPPRNTGLRVPCSCQVETALQQGVGEF